VPYLGLCIVAGRRRYTVLLAFLDSWGFESLNIVNSSPPIQVYQVTFQVLMAASIKMAVFWIVVPCSLAGLLTLQRCLLALSSVQSQQPSKVTYMADTWEIFLHIIHSFIPLKANIMILPLDR
jgi:hypothetical protein